MRYISVMALVSMLALPAQAQDDQVQRGPVPDWVQPSPLLPVPDDASGMMFSRQQDTLVHLDDRGEAQYLGYRMKILHANALQLGNLSIIWNPASGAPVVHAVRIHRGDQVIDVLENTSFEILRREELLEAAMLTGMLTAVLRIADLRVGDELEVAMTTRTSDPTLGEDSAGALVLGPAPPMGRFRMGISWEDGQEPDLQMTPYMTGSAERSDHAVDFRFDDPATMSPPKDAPMRYQLQRMVEYSDFADWSAVSRRFAPLFAKAATVSDGSPLQEEAARIAAAYASPLERAAAALKLVQQDIRYIYIGLDGGNLMPATAEETWQRRYGDCKGKTALLLALLSELGITGEPVLVNSTGMDDGLDERLPNPMMFDHVLVRATIDGARYWLDGTLPPVAPPSVSPMMDFGWVLPVSAQGMPLEHLEWHPAERPDKISLYEIDARAGFDKPAQIISTEITRGIGGLQQQLAFSGLTQGQVLNSVRQNMIGDMWQAIDDVEWRYDQQGQAMVLTITGTGTVDWDGKDSRSLALPGGGFNPPERRVRASDQDQNIPYYNDPDFDCRVTTVRLPDNTQEADWSFGEGFDTRMFGERYYRAFELRDRTIRMVRGFRTEEREIDGATARRDNDRIASFDNSMAWIYYDPGEGESVPEGGHVPATYEIDWTADSLSCLGAGE